MLVHSERQQRVKTSYQGSKSFREWCAFRAFSLSMGYKLNAEGKGPRLAYVGNKPTVTGEADADWVRQREAGTAAKLSEVA